MYYQRIIQMGSTGPTPASRDGPGPVNFLQCRADSIVGQNLTPGHMIYHDGSQLTKTRGCKYALHDHTNVPSFLVKKGPSSNRSPSLRWLFQHSLLSYSGNSLPRLAILPVFLAITAFQMQRPSKHSIHLSVVVCSNLRLMLECAMPENFSTHRHALRS